MSASHSRSCGTSLGQCANSPSIGRLLALDPLAVTPGRLDQSGLGQQVGQRLGRRPRVVGVALPAAEDQRGDVERPGVGVGQAGHVLTVARAVRQHPALHGGDERRPVLVQEALPVARVVLLDLGPLGQVGHRLHAVGPGGAHRPAAVVRRQRQQAVDAAADPPDGQAGRRLGMAGGGEQRHPGAPGPAGDDGGRHVEVGEQPGQRVGLHGRLRGALEAHVGLAAVGAVPDEHLVSRARPARRRARARRGTPW